ACILGVVLICASLPAVSEAGLSAPYGLAATAISGSQIALSWADSNTSESGFGVERSLDGVTFAAVATTGQNVTTYTNGGLSSGVRYYYRVRALGGGNNNSGYSNTASAVTLALDTIPPSAPSTMPTRRTSRR